jgi:NAD(P)-dependent dehydrogenase (short-subunit alcohol dehydrogenase family)
MNNEKSKKRRNVLITGSSRGIGAAVAKEFAAHGDRIAVHYVNSADLASEVISNLEGEGHISVQADLFSAEAIKNAVDQVAQAFGDIDILINNAGVFHYHPIETTDYETWQKAWSDTLTVNLIAAANMTWCALQHMPKQAQSRIINVGSRGGFRGEPKAPAYGASKAAIAAFAGSIAQALAPHGISVLTLAPGFVETEMAKFLLDSPEGIAIRAQSPFDRVANPEEVAKAIYLLASPEIQWASGAVLDFNGASFLRI